MKSRILRVVVQSLILATLEIIVLNASAAAEDSLYRTLKQEIITLQSKVAEQNDFIRRMELHMDTSASSMGQKIDSFNSENIKLYHISSRKNEFLTKFETIKERKRVDIIYNKLKSNFQLLAVLNIVLVLIILYFLWYFIRARKYSMQKLTTEISRLSCENSELLKRTSEIDALKTKISQLVDKVE